MIESRNKWIMHVDMDAFFASIEQRDRPECRCRPVVVGAKPGGRGVVSTCSYEARRFGIRSAMPIAEAYRRCPDAIFLKPDMHRYAEASRLVMSVLRGISPVIEPVSVDEAYLDITGLERLFGEPDAIGRLVKKRIWKQLGLSCSVGIGPNRLIAKLASEHNKPDGLTVVAGGEVSQFLGPMSVANLRGVGPQTLKIVRRLGIRDVEQLKGFPLELLHQYFGEKMGQSLYRQARGEASDHVGDGGHRQSISKETTFNQDITDRERLRSMLRTLASEVGRNLRREELKGQVVTLKVRFSGFETYTRQRRLPFATDADITLFQTAWSLFEAPQFASRPVRLIGLGASDWALPTGVNLDLFETDESSVRQRQLYSMLDDVAERFGKGKLSLGVPAKKRQ